MNIEQSCLRYLDSLTEWTGDVDELAFLHGDDPQWEPWRYHQGGTDVPAMVRSLEFVFTHPCRDARLARESITVPDRLRAVASIQQGVLGLENEAREHARTLLMLVAQPNGTTHCLARRHDEDAKLVAARDLAVAPHPAYDAQEFPDVIGRELDRLKSLAGAMEVNAMARAL